MKLSTYAYASYFFYIPAQVFFQFITYAYYEGGESYELSHLPGDIGSVLMPLIFAGVAALVVRAFNQELYLRVFQWVVICFSVLVGLFSLFAAYLAWWSATK